MRFIIYICLLGVLLSSSGCRRNKLKKSIIELSSDSEKVEPKKDSLETKIESASAVKEKFVFPITETDFETCKIKSKVSLNSSKIKQTIPANIHIKKDSIIWVSVSLGLEAARAIITPDTIQLLDRLNRKTYCTSFKGLSKMFGFDIEFQIFQAALLGNLPIKTNEKDVFSEEISYLKLLQERNGIELENRLSKDDKKLYLITAANPKLKSNMEISYKNFISENQSLIPTLIQILFLSGKDGEKTTIDFEHSKFDFLDRNLRFPFNVPKNYEVIKVSEKF
jgi:hypothetical protein